MPYKYGQQRQAQKAETHRRILESAKGHFRDRAFEDVTVRDIAETAGVASGTVIAQFGSKAGLFEAMIHSELAAAAAAQAHVAAAHPGAPVERLMAVAEVSFQIARPHLSVLRQAMALSWTRDGDAEQTARAALAPALQVVTAMLEEARTAGQLKADVDARFTAALLVDLFFLGLRGIIHDGWSVETACAQYGRRARLVLGGLAAVAQV